MVGSLTYDPMKTFVTFLLVLHGVCAFAWQGRDSVQIYFQQGSSVFDPSLEENGVRLQAFVRYLEKMQKDTTIRIRLIRISGSASPEGNTNLNKQLAKERALCMHDYLQRHTLFADSLVKTDWLGIDWSKLTNMVQASEMPYRDEVLHILYHTPEWIIRNGVVVDGRKRQLGMLHGGRAWEYMSKHFFPELRSAVTQLICETERIAEPEAVAVHEPEPQNIPEQTITQKPEPEVTEATPSLSPSGNASSPLYITLTTNLLYDALTVPNLGMEFSLGRRWSVTANWMYAWWKTDRRHWYWRVYGGDVGIRKWLGKAAREKPLQGHHLGLYAQMITYDFETGGRGYLGDRWSWGVSGEYGYSFPIAYRLNLDCGFGIGYLGGEYKEYLPIDGHYVWQATKHRHWFGLTKAQIALVWLIGRNNYNAKKGGR